MSARRKRDYVSVTVDVDVSLDKVLIEMTDEDLLEELARRGKEVRAPKCGANELREWAAMIERGQWLLAAEEMRRAAFEMQQPLKIWPDQIATHPFLRFGSRP